MIGRCQPCVAALLAQSFRARLIKELPRDRSTANEQQKQLAHRGKALLKDLAAISFEMAQMIVANQDSGVLPDWFVVEIVRDLPRLAEKRDAAQAK